jgi:protein-glutamine gamma-glutamyltransferase
VVLERLRRGGYSYTFEPGIYGVHAADEFWFDKKQGFCEHIAAAYVILMRSMNIPARIVTGYQGGERNAVDGFWTIRQSDAHAWAEVWQDGEGWIRIDPTSAVSPSRVGQVARSPLVAGAVGQAVTALLGTNAPDWLNQARALWEAANNYWNQKILSYSQSQQLSFLNQLGFESPNWQDALRLLGWLLGLSAIAGALIMRPRQSRADRWLVLLGKAQQRIVGKSTGLPILRTTQELSVAAAHRWGPQSQAIVDWLRDMERLRYSHHSSTDLATLERQLRQLNWPT